MANRAARYNPDQVAITVGGVLIQGYADGEFITIEQITPGVQEECGTDGEVAVSLSNDRRLKIVIKLLQTSQSNPVLSQIYNNFINDPNGEFVVVQVEDTGGGTSAYGAESWVVAMPNSSFDRTAKGREWEIHVANGTRNEAGN